MQEPLSTLRYMTRFRCRQEVNSILSAALNDLYCMQIADAVWMSMLLSAFAGILAVTVVVATFYFIRYAGGPSCCSSRGIGARHQTLVTEPC